MCLISFGDLLNQKNVSFFRDLYRLTDLVLLFPSFIVAQLLRFNEVKFRFDDSEEAVAYQMLLVVSALAWVLSTHISEYYHVKFNVNPYNKIKKNVKVIFLFLILLPMAGYLFQGMPFSRYMFLYFGLIQGALVLVSHFLMELLIASARRGGASSRRLLVIGAGELGKKVRSEVLMHRELGIEFAGYLDDHVTGQEILGKTDQLPDVILNNDIQEIVIAVPFHFYLLINPLVEKADLLGVRIHFAIDYSKWYDFHVNVRHLGTMPLLTVGDFPLDNLYNKFWKRVVDIVFSLVALTLLAPLFVIVGLLVKFTSKGPVFFTQKRRGYTQKKFNCYKFRSMATYMIDENGDEVKTKDDVRPTKNDTRITPVGAFIRKYNIDELPQILNVLKGEMSLVGPRPHMESDEEEFQSHVSEYMARHFVKPGITGWAQVNGCRGPVDTPEDIIKRVEYDMEYIEQWSLLMDFKIMLMTLKSTAPDINSTSSTIEVSPPSPDETAPGRAEEEEK